jgi:hypothetical protein
MNESDFDEVDLKEFEAPTQVVEETSTSDEVQTTSDEVKAPKSIKKVIASEAPKKRGRKVGKKVEETLLNNGVQTEPIEQTNVIESKVEPEAKPADEVLSAPIAKPIEAVLPAPVEATDGVPPVEEVGLPLNILPDLIIDERIEDRIPSLNAEEYMLLEKNILAYGCRDLLITWNDTLVDGHNRYGICKKHNIPFNVIDKQFKEIEECLDFVDDNQIGRRNLTNNQCKITIGRGNKLNYKN